MTIELRSLVVSGRHGYLEEERRIGQRFLVDLWVDVDETASASDRIEDTVDYRRLAGFAGMFGAGLYGGFVQAGVGFLVLSVLGGILRSDLVRANALKLVSTLVFGGVALVVFIIAGDVVWLPGILLANYTVIGSLLGVRFALHVRDGVIRWIITVAVIATCVAALLK